MEPNEIITDLSALNEKIQKESALVYLLSL